MTYKNNNLRHLTSSNKVGSFKLFLLFSIFICSILSLKVSSQEISIQKTMSFKHLSIKDGLSQNAILDIAQDSLGFLWFATYDGLNRYDGYNFKVYSHSDNIASSLSDNNVNVLYINKQNELWLGTNKGVDIFNILDETFRHIDLESTKSSYLEFESAKSTHKVNAIYQDHANTMWVGTTLGLYYQDNETQSFKLYSESTFDTKKVSIKSIVEDNDNRIWVGTENNGLYRINENRNTSVAYVNNANNLNSISHNKIVNIYETNNHELWIGTEDGLNKYNKNSDSFERYRHNSSDKKSISSNFINTFHEDANGLFWIGTARGLNKFDRDNNTFIKFSPDSLSPSSLSHKVVQSIYEDKYGLLWVGTNGGGLNIFDPISHQFSGYQSNSKSIYKANHEYARGIYEDSAKTLWVGGEGKLAEFNREKSTYNVYSHDPLIPNSLAYGSLITMHEDKWHQLWIGSFNSSLMKLDPVNKSFVRYGDMEHVTAIHEDKNKDNILWLGSPNGLKSFDIDTNVFKSYPFKKNALISAIVAGDDDHLWLSDVFIGLIHFNKKKGTYTQYQHDLNNENSLISNSLMSMYINEQQELWIGSTEGLSHFNPKTNIFTNYTTADGLPNDFIYGILPDDQGNIWLSTNVGLSRLNLATKEFKNFDSSDGLQSNEFNAASYFKNKNGEFFFGGVAGFNSFFPEQITEHTISPDVVITDFHLFNKNVPLQHTNKDSPLVNVIEHTNSLTLTYRDYIFSFDFAALHFADPLQNKYAYQLEGFDENWVYTDATQRRATYTNLPSGEYYSGQAQPDT